MAEKKLKTILQVAKPHPFIATVDELKNVTHFQKQHLSQDAKAM